MASRKHRTHVKDVSTASPKNALAATSFPTSSSCIAPFILTDAAQNKTSATAADEVAAPRKSSIFARKKPEFRTEALPYTSIVFPRNKCSPWFGQMKVGGMISAATSG